MDCIQIRLHHHRSCHWLPAAPLGRVLPHLDILLHFLFSYIFEELRIQANSFSFIIIIAKWNLECKSKSIINFLFHLYLQILGHIINTFGINQLEAVWPWVYLLDLIRRFVVDWWPLGHAERTFFPDLSNLIIDAAGTAVGVAALRKSNFDFII